MFNHLYHIYIFFTVLIIKELKQYIVLPLCVYGLLFFLKWCSIHKTSSLSPSKNIYYETRYVECCIITHPNDVVQPRMRKADLQQTPTLYICTNAQRQILIPIL